MTQHLQDRIATLIEKELAQFEIVKFTMNPIKTLWWKFWPGVKITVKWPTGWTTPDHLGNQTMSSDPNDHYRPELERVIGKQGWSWDWRLEDDDFHNNMLTIKIHKSKAKWATYFLMLWT